MVPPPPPPVNATPLMKNPPETLIDPDVVAPVVAAPTVTMVLLSVVPPILFDVAELVVTFPVTFKVVPLNVKLLFMNSPV